MASDPRLTELEEALKRTTRWCSVVLLVLFLLVVTSACFACWRVHQALRPEHLVERVEKRIRKELSTARHELSQRLTENAPQVADQATSDAIAQMPGVRVHLEKMLQDEIRAGLAAGTRLGDSRFRAFLRSNHATIRADLVELQSSPRLGDRLMEQLENRVDRQLGTRMRHDAQTALELLRQVNAKLSRLAAGKGLSPAERQEREVLRILRTLQVRAASRSEKKSPPATSPAR